MTPVMQRFTGFLFAAVVGLLIAWFVYDGVTDPERSTERRAEERVVLAARAHLLDMLALPSDAAVVDPLQPNRVVGKVYVYPSGDAWDVSGYYRRSTESEWRPWLMHLDGDLSLQTLRLSSADPGAARLAAGNPKVLAQ